ncbi:MAG: serine/threonine protein kinase [Planctomycetota bacterium]|nr:MAG: serine/threonine protein kinase [Planctomycetota bacterium]
MPNLYPRKNPFPAAYGFQGEAMLGFGRQRKPIKQGPQLDEDGRPILVRWSREHLTRLCQDNPAFQVMTVDGLHWIDPFTRHLVEAAFDWQETAIDWMLAHKPWRKQEKILRREALYVTRWTHFLQQRISELPSLRHFLPNGRWLNPLTGKWVSGLPLQGGQISKDTLQGMARAMAEAELNGAGTALQDDYALKRQVDLAQQRIQDERRKRQSASLAPINAKAQAQSREGNAMPDAAGRVSISGRRRVAGGIAATDKSTPHQRSPHPHAPATIETGIPSDLLRELHIAGYTIGECLGRGGMAAVFKAVQRSLDREVALKVRVPEGDSFNVYVERFMREAKMAAQINHPNVVTIFDVGSTNSLVYMALQYFSGGDLAQQVSRLGSFSPSEGLRCCQDILKGLAAIHDQGYIHRDIKTANCFIASDGRVAVGDLGIARDFEHQHHITNPNAIVGTPAFMPPEQTIPGAHLDARSDIYAAGIVAFHLISGSLPFDGEHPMVILRRLISDPTPDLRDRINDIDPRIAALVRRLMDKDPEQRPRNAHQAADEIADLLQQLDRPSSSHA